MEENLTSIGVMRKQDIQYVKKDIQKDSLGDITAVYCSMTV